MKTGNFREAVNSVERVLKCILAIHDEVLILNTITHAFQKEITVSIKLLWWNLCPYVAGLRRLPRDKFWLPLADVERFQWYLQMHSKLWTISLFLKSFRATKFIIFMNMFSLCTKNSIFLNSHPWERTEL